MARAAPAPEPTQDPDRRLQESFEAFYLRMYPTMFLVARRRCGDKDADDQAVDGNDLANRVFDHISSTLSAQEQDVILMFVTGLTPTEIAGQLGLDASTVRTVLSRARKKLRDFLQSQERGSL
jgi:DNA-directed RNA polymerase specialized sigma24 family protein